MKQMRKSVFFSENCISLIEGKSDDDALNILAGEIADAQFAKQKGYGPPLDEINQVRRVWLNIYAKIYGRPDHAA